MELWQPYIKLVDFLAEMMGPDTEVVLHDLIDLDNSVIAIRNGHISGRSVGAPATNLVLKVMKEVKYMETDFLCNYKGYSKSGNLLKSSSLFIRDEEKNIIGVICVNSDCEQLVKVNELLNNVLSFNKSTLKCDEITETFNHNVEELTLESINPIVEAMNIDPKRMNQDEKIEVVKKLNEKGIFLLKGAVGHCAKTLHISESTLYRYLNKIKKEEG
ncbi:MAG: helix-turn-helix transcriptional regulator [Turicibacter sp.]